MESFRNIADETFPSFLGNSLNSSASILVENVTISSNPGLPVAASTVAKNKAGHDSRVNEMFSFVSIDDDIDDEEFFDNQLEAYFEQLIPPGVIRGDNDIGKLSDCCTALKLSENGLLQVSLRWNSKPSIPNSCETHIVYQNEEGKWVTDLAYYTSFDEEQDLNLSEDDKINEFITGSEAAAMIAQDQEEFEKTHRLLQAEKVDILNASEVANSSWKSAGSCLLPKMSDVSKDASYLRLSLGEFFGQRSEALGCLGGGSDVKRPSFGYHITSPKTRQPVALLRQFDASVGDTTQETSQFSEAFPGNYRDGVNEDKLEGGLSNHSDSVLSISTIASAIANASCSADPSQLAAMMMTLSNKNRNKRFLPGIVKEMELTADQALSSHVENSTFDMEKYLKKTDEIGHESERESIVKLETSARSSMSESSLLGKVKNKETLQADNLTSRCCSREDEGTVGQVKNAVPEQCNDLERSTRNIMPLSNVKFTKQPGKYVSVSPTKAKPVQNLNTDEETQSTKMEEKTKESSAAGSGNVKHVTFEKLSPTSQNKHQSVLPECDLQPLEDEQYSFRPSTSPLIHSSPSDTSGTAFSGSDADFISTSHYPKSSCKESTVSRSVYSSPSMSRLTYVSESDSTLKNTSVMCDPETHWVRKSMTVIMLELSTTIIRASPTPSQEQTNKNLEDYLCQRNRKGIQFSVDQKSEENELVHPERKLEGQGQELTKEDLPKNERQLTSAASKVAATLKELDPVISALASKFCVFQPLPVNVGAQEVWQEHTNKAQSQGLSSLSALPVYPGLRTCIPINQNAPGEQYIPISSFKSHVTTSESQTVSSGATLLPGHSLATTQFAQHHLGNIPSTGNKVLPQFHGCSSAGFSVPPSGLPYSSISAGRVENPVPVGIPLGSNIGPGSLGTAALCHPHSTSWNKNILNIRSCTVQPLGTSRNEWDFSMSPGVGHVKVPEELKFPNACCVGIASQTALSIFNPTERWLQVSIGILSISVNGEKVDPAKYQCLVFKNKTIVGPHSTDDLKILFLPCHSGIFQCILSVSSWPLPADAETVVQAEALASRVVLTAVAENPNLEVETGKQDYLDFGDLTSGSWKALPLKIINKTHAFVPIRLIINANAVAWRCFTNDFSEEFLARVDVEVDSPGPSSVIESIPLRARAGTARIHAPKDLQTIHLSASVGSTAKQQLPLKNAGNIGVNLKLKVGQDSCFSVEPDDLFLLPGEEQEVTVNFSPKNVTSTQSVLKILVLPSGPQYEVVIKGEMESVKNRPVSTVVADIPPILSNKQFIAWGGVKLGESVQQKLTLRNNSPSVTQHLRLVIRGQDQDCFQLQSIFGSEERLTSNWELKIRPKEDTNIYLMFTPTRVTCFFAKLEIKQLGIRSQPGIKFTIPLSGYGGTSSIILESVKKLSDSYTLTLDELLPSRLKRVSFRIRNTGSRAAYVKALCFANLQTKTVVDPQVMTVSPEKFILTEGTHEVITWNPVEKERNFLKPKTLLSTICFFCGDEISRQRYLCDIPRGTNDIRLFYANMRKIILTVVGYFVVNRDVFQQSPGHHLESIRSENAARLINATLDVLPVKGPQGPPLPVKTNDEVQNKMDAQQTWAVKPEHLILLPPSISGTADTGHVQIVNNSNRMLTFELSWPAHCLTITPQHGVIEPESRALILVSPNPSLATKPSVIPWSGLIYIHCDNEQKFIKVQIREAQDVSGTSSPSRRRDLFTLQSASPTVHVAKPLSAHPLTKMEIKSRSVIFPKTRAMDGTGSVYRATYSAFRCYRVSGTLEAHGKEKVSLMFLPRESGDYSQFWDLECHPVEKPSWKHKLRFQLSGTGTKAENTAAVGRASADTLIEAGSPVIPKRKVCSKACTTKITRGVYAPEDLYTFLPTRIGESRTLKVNLRNNSFRTHLLKFLSPNEPFYIKHSKYSLRSHHYINVPVQFKPQAEGIFEGLLAVHTTKYGCINIRLCGKAIAKE
uniref:Centrosomal protein 192 n=1 Tax=Chrysolophus pictus TaxID=9089 RepID=A0A8C3KW35_CHRPC